MGLRFNKWIGLRIGNNASESRITLSNRNKRSSEYSKEYSVRAAISGISYRSSFSKIKNNGYLLILIMLTSSLFIIASCKNETLPPKNKWYQGGTLHKSKIIDWKNATKENKLATCGDFCANIYKNNSIDQIKLIATNLMICIDEATIENDAINDSLISEIASMCLLLMEKPN